MKNKSILYSFTKSLLDTVSMHLFFDIPPTQSCSFSLIASLPLSFFWCLSHTLFLCTSLRPLLSLSIYLYLLLNLPFTFRIAIILLLFLHISLSLSVSLATLFLYLRDIIPLLLSFLLWYDYHNLCFCFNNYYLFGLSCCLLAWRLILNFSWISLFFFIFSFFYFCISSIHIFLIFSLF